MTISDGQDTFKGNQVTGDKLDVTAGWHGTTLPTNPTNEIPTNGIFILTGTDGSNSPGIYENTGTAGAPTWVARVLHAGLGDDFFGDGSDGPATNPVVNAGDFKQYTNLTISANTTWGASGSGPIVVFVSGTFDLQSGDTLTLAALAGQPAKGTGGSGGSAGGGDGSDGADGKSPVFIIAKAVTGIGTITGTGNVAPNAPTTSTTGADTNGNNGTDAADTVGTGAVHHLGAIQGKGAQGSTQPDEGPGNAKAITKNSIYGLSIIRTGECGSGGGGGEGTQGNLSTGRAAGAGAGGGGTPISRGGDGGKGGTQASTCNSCGGGGGGGGGIFFVLISKTLTAITITITGGAGGNGGNATAATRTVGGAGGGGGAAGVITVGDADNAVITVTGGAGGSIGTSSGTPTVASEAGDAGGITEIFYTFADFEKSMKNGIIGV